MYYIYFYSSIIIINHNCELKPYIFFNKNNNRAKKNILYWRSLVNYFFAYSTQMVENVIGS